VKFTELGLSGVWLIEPIVHEDERGTFFRHFCAEEFAAHGLAPAAVQGNVSENPYRRTLRGIHYQIGRAAEAKTLSCITGAIYDVVVDLRPDSPTFMQWIAVEISREDRQSLHVPVGCANGWLTLSPNTTIHYYMSEIYAPASARGFRYNDPAFGFRWPLEPLVIAERDRSFPDFDPASLQQP
jgi:dTDP-4-dehydrorhamnose 3,5-epimerase